MSNFNPHPIIDALAQNEATIIAAFNNTSTEARQWRPAPEKWSLLEIACHLLDEEREDFRARLQSVITNHTQPFTPIDPAGWVTSRDYASRDFDLTLQQFALERQQSIQWLRSLNIPDWHVAYQHPKFGPMTAAFLLANWLAHDYLHLRQITHRQYQYLQHLSPEPLDYAGSW